MTRFSPVDPDISRTEMTWIVMPSQANALGTVFGGQIMAWIDVCAAVAAQRYAGSDVVTAGMDGLTFLGPIRRGDIVVVRGMINQAWRTSMEIGGRVHGEDPTPAFKKKVVGVLQFLGIRAEHTPATWRRLGPVTKNPDEGPVKTYPRRPGGVGFKVELLQRGTTKGLNRGGFSCPLFD